MVDHADQRGIFASNCEAYFSLGATPLPLVKGQKYPAIDKWEQIPFNPKWIKQYAHCGIGIRCGDGLNIVDIDFDSTKYPEAYKYLMAFLPHTPYRIIGKREPGRMKLVYRGDMPNRKFGPVEILGKGAQAVVPPTIHEDGHPYSWEGEDLFGADGLEDLPELDVPIEFFENFKERFFPGKKANYGRRNNLIQLITAKIHDFKNNEEIFDEIWNYDQLEHMYFEIDGEWSGAVRQLHPQDRARHFIADLRGTIGIKAKEVEIGEDPEPPPQEKELPVPIPEEFKKYINEYQRFQVAPESFWCVNLMGWLCAFMGNGYRVRVNSAWEQPAILNCLPIAEPGVSKSSPFKVFKKAFIKTIIKNKPIDLTNPERVQKTIKFLEKEYDQLLGFVVTGNKPSSNWKNKYEGREEDGLEELEKRLQEERAKLIKEPSLLIQDFTHALLLDNLKNNTRSVVAAYDELGFFLELLTKGEHSVGMRQTFLEGHDGLGEYLKDTKADGEIKIDDLGLHLIGNIQPDHFKKYLYEGGRRFENDGLRERFNLMAYASESESKLLPAGDLDTDLVNDLQDKLEQFFNKNGVYEVTLSDKASNLFRHKKYEIEVLYKKDLNIFLRKTGSKVENFPLP